MSYTNIPASSGTNVLDYDGWMAGQITAMLAQVPTLTNFQEVFVAEITPPIAATANNNGAIEGGAFTPTADTSTIFTRSVFNLPKTGKWAIAFRGSIALPDTASDYTDIGICNAGATHTVTAHAEQSVSATLIYLSILGATATNVATAVLGSATVRNFLLTFDTTTVKLFIDGTLAASTATLTNLTDEAMFVYAYNHVGGDAKVARCMYGYVAP